MTTTELEAAYNSLAKRIEQIERLLKKAVSDKQLNEVSLVLENTVNTARADVAALKNRVTILETTVAAIV